MLKVGRHWWPDFLTLAGKGGFGRLRSREAGTLVGRGIRDDDRKALLASLVSCSFTDHVYSV